jgi:hypothetical protein
MPAVGHPPNISMLPILVNRYAICTVPALRFIKNNGFFEEINKNNSYAGANQRNQNKF